MALMPTHRRSRNGHGSANGHSALSCRVHVPAWGAWYVDVEIGYTEALRGPLPFVLADLTMSGTIIEIDEKDHRLPYIVENLEGETCWCSESVLQSKVT